MDSFPGILTAAWLILPEPRTANYGYQPSHHKQDDSPGRGGGGIRKQNPETNSNCGALDFCSKAEYNILQLRYSAQVGYKHEYIHIVWKQLTERIV